MRIYRVWGTLQSPERLVGIIIILLQIGVYELIQFWVPEEVAILESHFESALLSGVLPKTAECTCSDLPNKTKKQIYDKLRKII